MSNKDRWSALSMSERADLMNMYITNGISDLKEMKKHYNSFGGGGDTNDDKNNQTAPINYMYNRRGYSNTDIFKLPTETISKVQANLYKTDKEGEDITFNDDGDMVVTQKQMTPEQQVEYNRIKYGYDPRLGYQKSMTPEEGEQILKQLKAKTSSDSSGANHFFLNLHPTDGATLAKYLNTYADASSVIDNSTDKLPENIKALQSFNMDNGVHYAKNGGKLNLNKYGGRSRILNGTNEKNQTLSNTPPLIEGGTNETIGFMNSSYNMMNQPIMFNTPYNININKTHNTVEIPQDITNHDTQSTDEKLNTYKVASGDSLGKIAKNNNVPLESLIKANPQIKNPNMISIGQDIVIPQQEIRQSEESKLGGYEVQAGDTLSKIASKNNISLNQLISLNPQIKNINNISIGQKINLSNSAPKVERQKQWVNIDDLRSKEAEYNKTNLGAIQGATHDSNYVVIDKKGKKLTVYNADNEVVYETSDISTGLSGNDYNTKTFTRNGRDVYGEGNMSTPAGVTRISSMDMYHGAPSFQRVRLDSYGNPKKVYNDKGEEIDDTINSSFHLGSVDRVYSSNGCVRMSKKALSDLGKYINVGTLIYTLPDKEGSRFVLKDGNLSYEADNPYGITEKGKEKNKYGHDMVYQDDYNVFNNKTSSPIKIEYNGNSKSKTKNSNIDKVIDGISSNKEAIQKAFNVSDQHFNRIAQLALGILEQESQFGTSDRYRLKQGLRGVDVGYLSPTIGASLPSSETGVSLFDVIKTVKGNNTYDSLGMGQIKIEGDNEDTQKMYRKFGVTPENVRSDEKTAEAIMVRLLSMYKNEVQGREFKNKETGAVIDPYDALLYKYKGGTAARVLRNGQATGKNEYVQNVKKYSKDFTFYTYK